MALIAHMTDLHLRPRGLTCYRVSDTNMLAERAIRSLRGLATKPDALIITGDLTDRDDPREYALAREILSRLEMPVYLIPGNHDGSETMRREMAGFPGLDATRDGKIRYCADIGALQLIALDTHVPGKPYGELGPEQLSWLDRTLSSRTRPTLIALHHPPTLSGIAHMDKIGLADAPALAEVIQPYAHVERLLCGHVHRPIVAGFAGKIMTLSPSTGHQVQLDLTEDGPSMFNFEPAAYFLHHHTPEAGVVTHMAYVEEFPGPHHFYTDSGIVWPGDER